MSKDRTQTWSWVVWIVVCLVCAAGFGVYTFLNLVSTPLHPDREAVPSVAGGGSPPIWAKAVERARGVAREELVAQNLPGLSVAVGVDDGIAWAEGFGWADLEHRTPVTPGMRFRIGHVSKALTSAAVGILLEQGRIDLDAEIQAYVPAYPRQQWPVTLRQLMGHVGGVRHYDTEADYMPTSRCERASEGVALAADAPLLFEPGTRQRYSTYGWILVSAAVEAAAREPFFTFMRMRVFEPLGMDSTAVDSTAASEMVAFYYPRFSGDPATGSEPARAVDYSCFAGAGAFVSTPSDLVRFGSGLRSGRLLERHTVATLQSPQLLASGQETPFGLGWMLDHVELDGERTPEAGHASLTLLGSSTSFLTFPERRIVVAVMSNTSRAGTRAIALKIAEVFTAR